MAVGIRQYLIAIAGSQRLLALAVEKGQKMEVALKDDLLPKENQIPRYQRFGQIQPVHQF